MANAVVAKSDRRVAFLPVLPAQDVPPEARLREAIHSRTPDQLDVLGLRFVAGHPADVIAKATGRGVGRVQALQHRALLALRRALALEPDPQPGSLEVT